MTVGGENHVESGEERAILSFRLSRKRGRRDGKRSASTSRPVRIPATGTTTFATTRYPDRFPTQRVVTSKYMTLTRIVIMTNTTFAAVLILVGKRVFEARGRLNTGMKTLRLSPARHRFYEIS